MIGGAGCVVQELFVWIAIKDDGSEGVMAAEIDMGTGDLRFTPLMSSKREIAEGPVASIARHVQEASAERGAPYRIELRHFSLALGNA